MDDALLVRGLKRLGNLLGDRQCFINRNWSLGDAVSCQDRGTFCEGKEPGELCQKFRSRNR